MAAFPLLADLFARGDMSTFRLHINSAMRHIIFWSVPAIALIIVLRAQLVRVILGAGAFDWDDTRLTAAVLAILSISLVAQAINLLFIRALYAGGYTRAPLLVAVGGFVTAVAMAYGMHHLFLVSESLRELFETTFRVVGVPGTEVLMIAVAYTTSVIGQGLILSYIVVQNYKLSLSWVRERLVKSVTAAIAGGIAAYGTLNFVVLGIDNASLVGIFLQGALAGSIGLIVIAATYYVLRMPEFFEVTDTLRRRMGRMSVGPNTSEGL